MKLWRVMLVSLMVSLLAQTAQGQGSTARLVTTSFGRLPTTPNDLDAQVALKAPAYAGLWVNGTQSGYVIMVTSLNIQARSQVVQELVKAYGKLTGFTPKPGNTNITFVMGKFNAVQLSQARQAAYEFGGWAEVTVDSKNNRVQATAYAAPHFKAAQAYFMSKGIPKDAVQIVILPRPQLPAHTTHAGHPLARLVIPARVKQGEPLIGDFLISNRSREPLKLVSVCMFTFEVIQVQTKRVVWPLPDPVTCYLEGNMINVAPSETRSAFRNAPRTIWDLRGSDGLFVPAGEYLIRSAYGQSNFAIRAPDVKFIVLPRNHE